MRPAHAHISGAPVGVYLLVALAAGLFIAGNAASSVYWDRLNTIAEHEGLARDLASIVADQTARSVRDTDLALRQVGEVVRAAGGLAALRNGKDWQALRRIAERVPGGTGIFVVDPEGRVVASSETPDPAPLSVADRDYMTVLAARDVLHVGPATFSRIRPDEVIYTVSRRIEDGDGVFVGVASAGVATAHLTEFHALLGSTKDPGVAVFRADGDVIARRPNVREYVGRGIGHRPLFRERLAAASEGVFRARSPLDDIDRINAYRLVGDAGLVVLVGIRWDVAMAEWERRARRTGLFALVSMVVVSLGTVWGVALSRRAERASRALDRALHDHLTGLPARALFMERAGAIRRAALGRGEHLVLMIVDLDGFKAVNDTHGHDIGDQVLVDAAAAVWAALEDGAVAGRLGGDEFGVCFRAPAETVDARVEAVAGGIVAAIGGIGMGIGCSLGVAVCAGAEASLSTALRRADMAMYAAKRSGKNGFAVLGEGEAAEPRRPALEPQAD